MNKEELKLEESLRSLKSEVKARPALLRDILDSITKNKDNRFVEVEAKDQKSLLFRTSFLVGALAIFFAVIVGNNKLETNKDLLASDVTDLLLDSNEIALELEEMEWILEQDMALLDIDLDDEVL